MVVMLVAIFFFNPLAFSGPGPAADMIMHHTGNARSLSAVEELDSVVKEEGIHFLGAVVVGVFWALRVLFAALCFGWFTLRSLPKVMANSKDSVHFWRLRKQAEKDLEKVVTLFSSVVYG